MESVATTVEPRIQEAELARLRRERPGNLIAYDLYLRALPRQRFGTQAENAVAFGLLEKAVASIRTTARFSRWRGWHCNIASSPAGLP